MEVDYRVPMAELFREAFEGKAPGAEVTWFLEDGDALFDVFTAVDAAGASRRAGNGTSSIGGHLSHVLYTLALCNAYIRQETPVPDWEGSWRQQEFSEEEWQALEADMRREFAFTQAFLEADPYYPEMGHLKGAMSLLPHMGYHCGAIRQLRLALSVLNS
jgi:hypothetical protein